MNSSLICADCGHLQSHFVLTFDDVICVGCAKSHSMDGESNIVRTIEFTELSACEVCESAYLRHEDEDHNLCSIICLQTKMDAG